MEFRLSPVSWVKEGDGMMPTPPGEGAWPKDGDRTCMLPGDTASGA